MSCLSKTSGLLGSILYSSLALRNPLQYKNMFWILAFSSITTVLIAISLMNRQPIWTIIGLGTSFGAVVLGINALVFEELLRRIHPNLLTTASTLISIGSITFSAASTYATGFFVNEGNEFNGTIIVLSYAVVFALTFMYSLFADFGLFKPFLRSKSIEKIGTMTDTDIIKAY